MTTLAVDLIVVGGGPAGMRAAIAARQHGLSVALIDEGQRPGGQIYRSPNYPMGAADLRASPDLVRGEALRAELAASGAVVLSRCRAWFAARGFSVRCFGPDGDHALQARTVVIATGTTERVLPLPGSTLPGVIGLAAATILLKAHGALPAGPTVVAGVGPLLYAVAAGVLKAGGNVAAVVDLLRPTDWSAALPGLVTRPDLLARGAGWMSSLVRAGVPVHAGATVTAMQGADAIEAVEISPVSRGWSPAGARTTIAAGSVAIGHGLTPATEVARLLGVPHHFSAELGGWVPALDADRRAAEGIYIAGDCAGVCGAAAAEWAGTLAGLGAARDLGAISAASYAAATSDVRRRLAKAERFGRAISRLMTLRPGLTAAVTPATIVCRCEDIPRTRIDEVTGQGARTLNQLKSTTRCGMGPCQGRSCGEAAAEIVAGNTGQSRTEVGQWTARAPLRPIALDAALGEYTYADIPKPPMLPA